MNERIGELIEKEIEKEKLTNREKELILFIAGIASLYSFIQSNFTGPVPSFANKVFLFYFLYSKHRLLILFHGLSKNRKK